MVNTGYLYSVNNKRLFVNTSLGCSSSCSFCYLNKLGYKNGCNDLVYKSSDEIIEMLNKEEVNFNKDTLVSFGCFSECFSFNALDTIRLIEYFIKLGNQVQVSTKKQIDFSLFSNIISLQKYYGQLVIFTSSSTISEWEVHENGTDEVDKRFQNFLHIKDIPVCLYIKPVIEGVTINDIDAYIEYIKMYGIKDVVVGSIFTSEGKGQPAPFLENANLFYDHIEDEDIIASQLSKYAMVERRSSKVLEYYKR